MEKLYKIENLKSLNLSGKLDYNQKDVMDAVHKAQEQYLPWQEFKNKSWVPDNKEEIWSLVRLQRQFNRSPTPIKDKDGNYYTFNPRSHVQFLHQVDLELGGHFMGLSHFNESDRRQIIRRNLIEESIASSRLEGANTSREVAQKMLHEGRKPRNVDEQMIVNNHEAMKRIEEDLKHEKMSLELLKNLHVYVTKGTLVNEKHQGTLRETFDEKGNRLKVIPWDDMTIGYVVPDREFVEIELSKLIAFANDENESSESQFIHPLTKAIMLHFWIGLLHPFEDGNGRLARIIFYWYMLRKGYWAFAYLSLSERILKSPKQYAMGYIYSEQDEYDLNYFIHYNMKKLKLAREQFQEYLQEKISENKRAARIIKSGYNFNRRQLQLLQYFANEEQEFTTLVSYQKVNSPIGSVTAATDIKKLLNEGFLKKIKNGRNVYYYPTKKVSELMK